MNGKRNEDWRKHISNWWLERLLMSLDDTDRFPVLVLIASAEKQRAHLEKKVCSAAGF